MRAGTPPAAPPSPAESLFAGCLGLLLGIGLLKFGNPIILDRLVSLPRSLDEWRVFAWPVRIGHLALLPALAAGIAVVRSDWRPRCPAALAAALGFWLAWQLLATMASVDPALSRTVLGHLACCTAFWLLGNRPLRQVAEPRTFWLCLTAGFLGVLALAADQRFGGLEETRKMILSSPGADSLPAEYLARIRSNRVFSTLVYPNALAGAVLLLLPPTTVLAFRAVAARRGTAAGRVAGAALLLAGLAVLVWSGSKAGWLVAMALALLLFAHSRLDRRWKLLLAAGFLVAGLAAFTALYGERLRRGATSVVARFDYWSAAVHGLRQRPLLGHGPGAFKRVYAAVKRPESEMAQLAHNDYLQQAVDSGIPGAVAYAGFVAGTLAWLYRQRARLPDPLLHATWLGLAAWFTQGTVEFGLYIPATAWIAFTLLGWMCAVAHDASPTPAPTTDRNGSPPTPSAPPGASARPR